MAERFGLGAAVPPPGTDLPAEYLRFAGRLAIPYFTYNRNRVTNIKYRALDDETKPKYDGHALSARLFNLAALAEQSDVLILAEGELEAIVWAEVGYPCVGIPGATNWRPHHRLLFEGVPNVIMVRDDDDAGKVLESTVAKELEMNDMTGFRAVTVPGFKDAGEALAAGHRQGLKDLIERLMR